MRESRGARRRPPLLWCAALGCLVALSTAGVSGAAADRPPSPGAKAPDPAEGGGATIALRVMTFNVLNAGIPDEVHPWEVRRPLAIRVIQERRPAVVGLQEANRDQLRDLLSALDGYSVIPGGPWGLAWRFSSIIYDARALRVLDAGEFWLSDHPDDPGTTWRDPIARMASWAEFEVRPAPDRSADRPFRFRVLDTHLSNSQPDDRLRGAELIASRLLVKAPLPLIVMGDLNAEENDAPVVYLRDHLGLIDSYAAAGETQGPSGTIHFFRGRSARRIDHILLDPTATVDAVEIVDDHEGAQYPSDHFPVCADVRFPPAPPSTGSGGGF